MSVEYHNLSTLATFSPLIDASVMLLLTGRSAVWNNTRMFPGPENTLPALH